MKKFVLVDNNNMFNINQVTCIQNINDDEYRIFLTDGNNFIINQNAYTKLKALLNSDKLIY
jgi:hypothetical protein